MQEWESAHLIAGGMCMHIDYAASSVGFRSGPVLEAGAT